MRFSTTRLLSFAATTVVWATVYADTAFFHQTETEQLPATSAHHNSFVVPEHQEPHRPIHAQQFRILRSDRIKNYAVRIKSPVSCEEGVQVNHYKLLLFS